MPITQPIPKVTPDDVKRVVRRDYPTGEYAAVMTMLGDLEGSTRVQLAVLKMANANVQKLESCIEWAKPDYRNALAVAEYPAYFMASSRDLRNLTDEEKARIIESDWRQYEEWLRRPVRPLEKSGILDE